MRNALVLSTTTAPAFTASGANSLEIAPPGGCQHEVDILEAVGLEFLNRNEPPTVGELLPHRPPAGEQLQGGNGELANLEGSEHLLPNGSRGSHDGDIESHCGDPAFLLCKLGL